MSKSNAKREQYFKLCTELKAYAREQYKKATIYVSFTGDTTKNDTGELVPNTVLLSGFYSTDVAQVNMYVIKQIVQYATGNADREVMITLINQLYDYIEQTPNEPINMVVAGRVFAVESTEAFAVEGEVNAHINAVIKAKLF